MKTFLLILTVCFILVDCHLQFLRYPHLDVDYDDFSDKCECMEYSTCFAKGIRWRTNLECYMEDKTCCTLPSIHGDPKCGLHQHNKIEKYAWTVSIIKVKEEEALFVCGGTLIHNNVVLTAAHCVSDTNVTFKVRAENYNNRKEAVAFYEHDVAEVVIHPEFNNVSLHNDIALLILRHRLDSDYICLGSDDTSTISYTNCFATGWGSGSDGIHSWGKDIKRLDLNLTGFAKCEEHFRKSALGQEFKLHDSFICTAGEQDKEICKGYGGGPVVCPMKDYNDDDRYMQVGIISWGMNCDLGVTAHISVSAFKEWIDEIMKKRDIFYGEDRVLRGFKTTDKSH